MNNRKDFSQENLNNDPINRDNQSHTPILKIGVPENKIILFSVKNTSTRRYDLTKCYGKCFDEVMSAIQQTIEIMQKENLLRTSTIMKYCAQVTTSFTKYLSIYQVTLERDVALSDINTSFLENYIHSLKITYPNRSSAKCMYDSVKAILFKMQTISWLERFDFPRNPFPNSNRKSKGEVAFSKAERIRIVYALKDEINQILKKLNRYLLMN